MSDKLEWALREDAQGLMSPISKRYLYFCNDPKYYVNWFVPKLEGDIGPYALAMWYDNNCETIISRHKSVEAAQKACQKHKRNGGKIAPPSKRSRDPNSRWKARREKNLRKLRRAAAVH
jgi:hypothetical protein